MSKKSKVLFIFCFIFSPVLLFPFMSINILGSSSSAITPSEGSSIDYSGEYVGNNSVYGVMENWLGPIWNDNTSTEMVAYNQTIGPYTYELNQINIQVYNIFNGSDSFIVADNTSYTNQSMVFKGSRVAQEFTSPDLISLTNLELYINYSQPAALGNTWLQVFIYDEFFQDEIDFAEQPESGWDGWYNFGFTSNILEANKKYNIVLQRWADKGSYNRTFNMWRANNYSNPIFNKGLSRVSNGSGWIAIANDSTRDLMCRFNYRKVIDPIQVDMKFFIDNQSITPTYRKYKGLFGASGGYEASYIYSLGAPTFKITNVTIKTNTTIPSAQIRIRAFYVFTIQATGMYEVDGNNIEWTIIYPYKEIGVMSENLFFLFEYDWDYNTFKDPTGYVIPQIYFGPVTLFQVPYYGMFSLWMWQFERGDHTGKFSSPNYCNQINAKIKNGNDFQQALTLNLGQTIKMEAVIKNTNEVLISGGSGKIVLTSPSGKVIHSEVGISSIDGIISSSEIELGMDLEEGIYDITIFWTNGREIAFYSTQIQVSDPSKIIWIITFILIGAVASTPAAFVVRSRIRQRNWEKSLKNLFVFTSDGVSLYDYSFGIEIQDPALISGMIAALTNFVREATGSKKSLRTVDQEDKKVFLFHGQKIIVALLGEKDLPIIHKRVRQFGEAFEKQYGPSLKKWKGQTKLFKGAEIVVGQYFPIDVEEQIIRGVRQKLIEFREHLNRLEHPREIIKLMRDITDFISRYQAIVNTHYLDYYNQIIIVAEEKISGKLED
jgi:hypothetical protein